MAQRTRAGGEVGVFHMSMVRHQVLNNMDNADVSK